MVALGLAVLVAACGGSSVGPSAPDPTPATTTLTLDFAQIEVLEDCDGIEGDGEFHFGVATSSLQSPIDVLYSKDVVLGPGGKSGVLGRRSYQLDAIEGTVMDVEFSATELDRNILGEEYSDTRLDHAVAYVYHTYRNGHWSNLGPQSITLGSDGCRVRLYWTAEES